MEEHRRDEREREGEGRRGLSEVERQAVRQGAARSRQLCIVDVNFYPLRDQCVAAAGAGGKGAGGLPCVSSERTRMLHLHQGKKRTVISIHGTYDCIASSTTTTSCCLAIVCGVSLSVPRFSVVR